MPRTAGCSKPGRLALVIALSSLTGCATRGSEGVCPPVAAYPAALRARAAAEAEALPPDSAVAIMLADYAVLRAQARACR